MDTTLLITRLLTIALLFVSGVDLKRTRHIERSIRERRAAGSAEKQIDRTEVYSGQEIRLVGGRTYSEGRVEIYDSKRWGIVCDNNWDLNDANVVCRQLGFNSGAHLASVHFSSSTVIDNDVADFLFDNTSCQGVETRIQDCRHSTAFKDGCSLSQAATVSCLPNEGCEEGWIAGPDGLSCYKLENSTLFNQEEAEEKCETIGATLVAIEDQRESDFLSNWLLRHLGEATYWTAGRRTVQTGANNWKWTGTEWLIQFSKWFPGFPPKNSRSRPSNRQTRNCLALSRHFFDDLHRRRDVNYYFWNDIPCVFSYNAICEKKLAIANTGSSLVIPACGLRPINQKIPNVIGGFVADYGAFPWVAQIMLGLSMGPADWISLGGICGGTILNNKWILTAAHCLHGEKADSLRVIVGHVDTQEVEEFEQQFEVDNIVISDFYADDSNDGDIALIKIRPNEGGEFMNFSDHVQPACLPSRTANPSQLYKADRRCLISGWGSTTQTILKEKIVDDTFRGARLTVPLGSMPDYIDASYDDDDDDDNDNDFILLGMTRMADKLRGAYVRIISDESCANAYNNSSGTIQFAITKTSFCAQFSHSDKDQGAGRSTLGDSGGGLVCEIDGAYTVLGVVSWGHTFPLMMWPSVYTRVGSFTNWIEETIAE